MKTLFTFLFVMALPVFASPVIVLTDDTDDRFELISQPEAESLKTNVIAKRQMCFDSFADQEEFKVCYEKEIFSLVAEECVNIRMTESITQENCESFLYKIVMGPDSFFHENESL